MLQADDQLFNLITEPAARQRTAKANKLPSGALPVVAAVAFLAKSRANCRPAALYALQIASQSLVRRYVALLVDGKFLQRVTHRRMRFLRLTSEGQALIDQYKRAIREGKFTFRQDWVY